MPDFYFVSGFIFHVGIGGEILSGIKKSSFLTAHELKRTPQRARAKESGLVLCN